MSLYLRSIGQNVFLASTPNEMKVAIYRIRSEVKLSRRRAGARLCTPLGATAHPDARRDRCTCVHLPGNLCDRSVEIERVVIYLRTLEISSLLAAIYGRRRTRTVAFCQIYFRSGGAVFSPYNARQSSSQQKCGVHTRSTAQF